MERTWLLKRPIFRLWLFLKGQAPTERSFYDFAPFKKCPGPFLYLAVTPVLPSESCFPPERGDSGEMNDSERQRGLKLLSNCHIAAWEQAGRRKTGSHAGAAIRWITKQPNCCSVWSGTSTLYIDFLTAVKSHLCIHFLISDSMKRRVTLKENSDDIVTLSKIIDQWLTASFPLSV